MNKLMSLLIVLLLLFMGAALGEEVWDFDPYNYSLDGYTGAGGDVVIPEMIQECTVDIIGLNAFNGADGVTSLVLPGTVRQIEEGAVAFCGDLNAVTLNDGLMIIGDNCFLQNPLVKEMVIPASVCYIGDNAFSDNEGLVKVVFKGECPAFGGIAFDWLPEDAVIYVPDDQYDAYAAAFDQMEIYLNLQPSGANAETYDYSCYPEQFAFDAATGTLLAYEGYDVRVDVPAQIDGVQVKHIGDQAFMDKNYLCYLTLPEGLESIGNSAFEGCNNLLYVQLPETLKHIGSRAFAGGIQTRSIAWPEGLESIGDEAFYWAVRLTGTMELPQELKTIGASAFEGCGWLEEVYIPDSVEAIGEKAFADCGMNYVVFEGLELPDMPENVFENCWYLADIDLNTKAGKQQMLDLQAVVDALGLECRVWRMQNPDVDYVNDGLDVYENGVLTAYTGTQTHLRPWDTDYNDCIVTGIGDGVFKGNTTIEYFAVPYNDQFTTIGAEAFADSSVRVIDLFDSLTVINGGAFRNCVNLTELTLPESVEFVGVEALYGCINLKTLYVLCDPTVLPADLFDVWPEELEIYVSDDATDEQIKYLSDIAGRPFYNPVIRMSEDVPVLAAMPYESLPGEDFWYDSEFARLDSYLGYELNLVLPQQIDGTALTMIGGGMMQRAACGDNYEVELPVVSVVIPENYTDIPAYTFMGCETLETVICYAPLEMLNDSMFKDCLNLREVIFVNGIGGIGAYVFDNCPNLETVYVGPGVDAVSEYAFCDEFGQALWSFDKCITDPALMPDVDALLENVKCEPMSAPEPEPALVPAAPVGEEGKAFFGLWNGVEMIYGGESMDMVMTLILLEDGRMIVAEEPIDLSDLSILDGVEWPGWYVENGVAIGDGCVMTIMDDGRLVVEEDGAQLIFERAGAETAAAEGEFSYIGCNFVLTKAETVVNGQSFPVDAAAFGEWKVCFNADNSASLMQSGVELPAEYLIWKNDEAGNFVVDYSVMGVSYMSFVLTPADGALTMDYYGTLMTFTAE